MGGKMKSVIALVVVLVLIYWEQSSAVKSAYARDGEGGREAGETIYYFTDGKLGEELSENGEGLKLGEALSENGEGLKQGEVLVIRIQRLSVHQGNRQIRETTGTEEREKIRGEK